MEPIYSKAFFVLAEKLHKEGYIQDACQLIGEVNEKYLSTEQKLELETIKVDCSNFGH